MMAFVVCPIVAVIRSYVDDWFRGVQDVAVAFLIIFGATATTDYPF